MVQNSQTNASELKTLIEDSAEDLSQRFGNLKESLVQDSQNNVFEFKNLVEELSQVTASVKASLEQSSSIGFAGLKTNIGELANEFNDFQENFDIKTQ